MGRRNRQRVKLAAPVSAYEDAQAGVLAFRGALKPGARRDYTETLAGGIDREDARQRATELLFERLAVSWVVAGVTTTSARELLERYRMASGAEREFVRVALRRHVEENFPELEAP
ncbi:MAG: hypothetical protein M3022_05930 [Actinomycetota bacterium]|nr:hypothetical protein [Actinomycetota bacterium]